MTNFTIRSAIIPHPSSRFPGIMIGLSCRTPAGSEPLTIFCRNFCSKSPVITPEAASLHRTAMIQPGVYFTLDAPFVRVIALFSNSLEDPGVISSERGKWATVPDFQLEYLAAQLKRIKEEKYQGAGVSSSGVQLRAAGSFRRQRKSRL
jgi:hypothetical protein